MSAEVVTIDGGPLARRIVRITIPLDVVEKAVIEASREPIYSLRDWPAQVVERDAWGKWVVEFAEPAPKVKA